MGKLKAPNRARCAGAISGARRRIFDVPGGECARPGLADRGVVRAVTRACYLSRPHAPLAPTTSAAFTLPASARQETGPVFRVLH